MAAVAVPQPGQPRMAPPAAGRRDLSELKQRIGLKKGGPGPAHGGFGDDGGPPSPHSPQPSFEDLEQALEPERVASYKSGPGRLRFLLLLLLLGGIAALLWWLVF